MLKEADIAHSVEQVRCNDKARGAKPLIGSYGVRECSSRYIIFNRGCVLCDEQFQQRLVAVYSTISGCSVTERKHSAPSLGLGDNVFDSRLPDYTLRHSVSGIGALSLKQMDGGSSPSLRT